MYKFWRFCLQIQSRRGRAQRFDKMEFDAPVKALERVRARGLCRFTARQKGAGTLASGTPGMHAKIFKHIKESNTEALHNGDLRTTHQDYYVMDTYVYIENGDYVDGYIVSLYDDKIQGSEYARFYGRMHMVIYNHLIEYSKNILNKILQ